MFIRRNSNSKFISTPYTTGSGDSGLPTGVYIGIAGALFAVALFIVTISVCCLRKRARKNSTNIVPGTLTTGPAYGPMRSVGRVVQNPPVQNRPAQNQPVQTTPPDYHEPTAPPPTYGRHRMDKVYQVV